MFGQETERVKTVLNLFVLQFKARGDLDYPFATEFALTLVIYIGKEKIVHLFFLK